jgi:hypothetical protein
MGHYSRKKNEKSDRYEAGKIAATGSGSQRDRSTATPAAIFGM